MSNSEQLKTVRGLLKMEKAQEAKKLFLSIEPGENSEYFLIKGAIEQKYQNWAGAINAFNKVLDIEPDNEEAKNNLHLIQNIINFWNPDMFNP
jgi:tetratricopeptide (TPR) repeat protein